MALPLRKGDRERLRIPTPSWSVRAGIGAAGADRGAGGRGLNTEIAQRVAASRLTVTAWLDRYASSWLAGLEGQPRSGRPRSIDHAGIVTATLSGDVDETHLDSTSRTTASALKRVLSIQQGCLGLSGLASVAA